MLKTLREAGIVFNAVRGWLFMAVVVIPTALTYLVGFYEGQPWSAIIAYTTITFAAGALLALCGLKLYEGVISRFTSRSVQSRIKRQLDEYINEGETMIDTPTAAGIWAGTLKQEDVQRHLHFRMLKLAINNGTIRNPQFKGESTKANMYTKIPLAEFVRYLNLKGVLE